MFTDMNGRDAIFGRSRMGCGAHPAGGRKVGFMMIDGQRKGEYTTSRKYRGGFKRQNILSR